MSLTLKDAKKTSMAIPPVGSHPARCFAIVDLGSHTENGNYGVTTNRKIRFSWELPDELHVFDEKLGPQPFAVHRLLNFVIAPKSNFQKMLESWRGVAFTEAELDNFEVKRVLGAPCMLTVVHTAKGSQTYANVDAVVPLPAKWRAIMSAPINKPVYYEIEMGRNEIFKALPEWLRQQIEQCNEWNEDRPTTKAAPHAGEVPTEEQDPFQASGEPEKESGDGGRPF